MTYANNSAATVIIWKSNKAMTAVNTLTRIAITDSTLPVLPPANTSEALAATLTRLGKCLDAPRLVVAVSAIGHATAELSTGEKQRYQQIHAPERRQSWLAGRAVIKAARARLGLGADTSALHFPDACTSLTHAAGFAIAVAAPKGALHGLGVDLEARRITSSGIERFFLTESERDWIEHGPAHRQCDERIRLWTVKEAVYKACPDNSGMTLSRIELQNPASSRGEAISVSGTADRVATENRVSYASKWTLAGCVSLALLPVRPRQEPGVTDVWMGKKQ